MGISTTQPGPPEPAPAFGTILRWHRGKESTCQCRRCKRHEFSPWVGKIPWRRKWQPTAVFFPGEFLGWRSLAGYSPWGRRVRHDGAAEHSGSESPDDGQAAGPAGSPVPAIHSDLFVLCPFSPFSFPLCSSYQLLISFPVSVV